MLIFFIVCLGYGKLILQGTQTNECKIYITEIEENSQIILKSDNQNIQLYLDIENPCHSKTTSCRSVICDITQKQLIGINCIGICNIQVHLIQKSDLLELDKEAYYVIDNDVINLKFNSQSQLINTKYLVFESELVNPQQNWDNLNYILSVRYSDIVIYAKRARMGTQLIEVEVDSILLNSENILIQIEGRKESSFKIQTHAYNQIRNIKLFDIIDGIFENQIVKTYQLDYSYISDLHKNKDLFIKISIQSGIVDACVNINEIPRRFSDSQLIVNTDEGSEIIIHKQDLQSANYIYIMIKGNMQAIYTLKINIEGEMQYIDSGEIIMGKLYPNSFLQNFQFQKNKQNLYNSLVIEKKGDFDLAVLDCELYTACNVQEWYQNQQNVLNQFINFNQENQTAKYTLIHDQIEIISIQHQYLSFAIIATKQEIIDFQLKILGKDAIVYLKENKQFNYSSSTSSRTKYKHKVQKQVDLQIGQFQFHLIRNYGQIQLNGDYSQDYITIDNLVSDEMIDFDIVCHHTCDYSVNLQIFRNYQNSIANQAILFDNSKSSNLKIEDQLFFELPIFNTGYYTLYVSCQEILMIEEINYQTVTLATLNHYIKPDDDLPIFISQNCQYLRISTEIPQIISITLITNKQYHIEMNEDVHSQLEKYENITYTYSQGQFSNTTILVKSLNNKIPLSVQVDSYHEMISQVQGIENVIHISALSYNNIKVHIQSNHSTVFYLKIQENSEFYYYHSRPLKLYIDQDQVKIVNLGFLRKLLTYSVNFDKPVPFNIYFNLRKSGDNEFPNATHHDYMSYHSDSIFQYYNQDEQLDCQQLILIQFAHVVNQVLTFQISKILKIQPGAEQYLHLRKEEIMYFEIDTYTNLTQIIFMFGWHQKALFLLEKGCNKTIQKQDFNYGYDLLRETNIEFNNITNGCYIGGIYNPYDTPNIIKFQWIQQTYVIHDYINNTVMTKQASEVPTYFYIDVFEQGKMTFYPYEGYLKILQVPILMSSNLPQVINLIENNDTELDYKICNLSCTIIHDIENVVNQQQALLVKILFQQTKTYTIFMEDLVYNQQLQFDGTVLFQKSLKEGTRDLFNLIEQQSQIIYIRTITGQLDLTLTSENQKKLIKVNQEMQNLDLEDKNYTIELTSVGSNTVIYEIQTQIENIKLKFGQLYFGNNQKIIFILPLVDYEQHITYGVSVVHQQLCDCQISIKIWNRFNQIYTYYTNQSNVIESLPIDLNQHEMEVEFQCDPPQYEEYYVYIQPSYTHLSMVMINKGIQFNTESMSNDVYFVNIEQLGFVVIEITQLKGQIIAYATRNVNMIYNGISELSVQAIDNFHYKLILEVDSWGILYFGIKCISSIKCEYIINVKQINGLEFNLNDIKLGTASYNYQSKNLTINSSIQVSNKLKTERYAIYYDKIKSQANKYISQQDGSIILNDFSGQQLFVEMEFTVLDSDYSSKLMYDPVTILQEHTIIVKSESYLSYILLVLLLILGFGLLLYILQLKRKLKYEMSDARNIVHSSNEIELNSK